MNRAAGDNSEDTSAVDVRPLVARDTGNRPLWIGIGAILLLGLMLFFMLEGRRQTVSVPAVRPRVADLAEASSPLPPLYIPPQPAILAAVPRAKLPELNEAGQAERIVQSQFSPKQSIPFQPTRIASDFVPAPTPQPAVPPKPAADTSPAIVFDQTIGNEGGAALRQAATPVAAIATPARAGRARDRATIVPQGTLIAAVLETALDSTQPGQTRALVSRDVPNLAGPVLIPRGSRLYGEYRAELGAGQKRAMVQWTRLVTPDGVTIAIDSPAADQLGRAGIEGKVNSQFAARLGGALLQSVIDIGTIAAVGGISNSRFFVPVTGAVEGSTSQLVGPTPKPTLKVRQGTRISVFVARDLDFSAVGSRR